MEAPNAKESLNCAGCLNDIGEDDYVSALGQDWHKDCFRCSVCDTLLSTWYFEKAGLLFCQSDYWSRYGECCQQCTQVITGPVMAAGEHRFHPECFACSACGAHIEDGEPYALVERSKLYCGACYEDTGRVSRAAHAIRAVEVPADALRLAPTECGALQLSHGRCVGKLSAAARALLRAVLSVCIQLSCHRIDSMCGLLALHIGDRILEINGTPVQSRPFEEIERVLSRPDALIQLTIEHNPETVVNNITSNNNNNNNSNANNKPIPVCDIQTEHDDKRHDIKSPVEKKILKEDQKKSPKKHSTETTDIPDQRQERVIEDESAGKRERLFKRKGDGGGKSRVIKRRQTPSSPLLGDKERSSSMSKLLDVVEGEEANGVQCDLSRARSFRAEPAPGQKVFRACDLLQGELLGAGFFGQVYKVTHRDTNEVMVLKQLYRVDDDAQRNFLKEVAVLRSLRHPNVLRFVGVLYKDKRLHLVTEYVAGGTLHQLLQDNSVPLSWTERGRLARDVAAGVGYLHRRNVVHRDLNSHNCLVREDKTVIVADFGLARIVQRTASSARDHHSLRRKRYTVVGNPYWMAPEMMNGNVYDEKVDVFSFGIILCEIIGRVSADPDYLPRRADFGLNEVAFIEQFCRPTLCPEPFYRAAFLACHLQPEHRPRFEVMEIWLESLVMCLSRGSSLSGLLADIEQYAASTGAHSSHAPHTAHTASPNDLCVCALSRSPSTVTDVGLPEGGVVKSQSNATVCITEGVPSGRALGKCVSASHIAPPRPIVTVSSLSRSHNALHTPGYILRSHPRGITITKVDDITEWLDPPPALKRTSGSPRLNAASHANNKTRRIDLPHELEGNLPPFLRNQSVEELESETKHHLDAPTFCRHYSIPDRCDKLPDPGAEDTDSSDDDLTDISHKFDRGSDLDLQTMDVDRPKNIIAEIVKKGENLLSKKSSYDVTDVILRNPECLKGERRIPETDCRRYNIDHVTRSPMMAEGVKNIPKTLEMQERVTEKSNFFSKKLLSPKLSRLFKPHSPETVRTKLESEENRDEKSRSKFFIQRPSSPGNVCRAYRVRPIDEADRKTADVGDHKKIRDTNILKSDLKLASMGKPMTPIFRRHTPDKPDFADGRFSYRDRRSNKEFKTNLEPKFIDIGRNRIKAPITSIDKNVKLTPLIRSAQTNNVPALATVLEKKDKLDPKEFQNDNKDVQIPKKRESGISRSNYVSLANLKINGRSKDLEKTVDGKSRDKVNDGSPAERVI